MPAQSSSVRRTQAERRAATRAALLRAGRALFTERGFAGTSSDEIAARAGVTRGALHHHFDDKRALFRAVVEELEAELVQLVAGAAASGAEPAAQIRRGIHAYLAACLDPTIRQVALLDAPTVLGWAECRQLDREHCLGLLRSVLESLPTARGRRHAELQGHLLLGAVNEAALCIAEADNPRTVEREMRLAVDELVDALFQPA